MTTKPPTPSGLYSATEPIDVRFGAFDLSHNFRVPYMTSVLRFQQVAEYLDLVTADPKYVNQDWKVEELFQREVSQKRVIDLVDNYLTATSRPQFFNSLTIVLRRRELTSGSYRPPPKDREYECGLAVGPIMVSYDPTDSPSNEYPIPLTHGRLAWNRDQVYAVAIDGQHRLAAIKELRPDARYTSSVSVLFIIPDPVIGFSAPTDWTELTAMRSIFVDLNKRAMPVSRARNLLLDDIDPSAQFVRRLFGPALNVDFDPDDGPLGLPMGANGEFDTRIPLVLVDWHGETRSKVEQGPYLSSVLALDWTVTKTLGASYPKRPPIPDFSRMSVDEENYHDRIRNNLKHWENSWTHARIEEQWEECKETDQPFSLDTKQISALADEFENTWGRPVTRILTTVGPYAKLVALRRQGDTLTPQFSQWYQARSDREIHARSTPRIRRHYQDRFDSIENVLRPTGTLGQYRRTLDDIERLKQESVFFYLVGQRALLLSLIELVASRDAPELAVKCGISLNDFQQNMQDFYAVYLATAISEIWNRNSTLFQKGCRVRRDSSGITSDLASELWAGTLVRREQPDQVDFSENAARRGSRWFTLMAHLYWFVQINDLVQDDVETIVSAVDDDSKLDDYLLGTKVIETIGVVVGVSSKPGYYMSPMCFLVGDQEEQEGRPHAEMARAATKERIRAVAMALVGE